MIKLELTTRNIPLEDDVKRIVNEKLKKLEKLLVKFPPDSIKAVIMLKKRARRSEDDIYVTNLAFYLPSKIFHADQDGYTLEESLGEAIEDIKDQLKKHKEKMKIY